MVLSARTVDGVCRIEIEGEMNIHNAADIQLQLARQLDQCSEMEIDLSKVSELDSSGLQLLVLVKREAMQINKVLRLVCHSPAVIGVLDTLNIASFFGDSAVILPPERQ